MSEENPSIVSHISLGTNDFDRAVEFYDKVMPSLGAKEIMKIPGAAIAYGKYFPEFWIQRPINGELATTGNGTHVAFVAANREQVDAFWTAALSAGAKPDGEPGTRPEYGESYYGCFVRDLDDNKIEATFYVMGSE